MNNQIDILAFGAHPDDVELGCAGTLAKSISEGKSVVIVDLTQGELGSRGTVETRYNEAEKAGEILGIQERINLKLEDGFFENNRENQLKIIQLIRRYQPRIIITNPPTDRHPDHGKACELVCISVFLSGLLKVKTEFEGVLQKEWRPFQVYHYIQWDNLEPDFVVDISGFESIKLDSCMAYETQFYKKDFKEGKITPISTKNFKESILYRMKDLGRITGVDYAEGFLAQRKISVKNIFDLH
ncbi:MAG: bacillithiol biosynthesis deacetylase BshB1 [Flavobacteriales bacterium]|nr:bacillithiol biosynthesis deacetylase BshB1 [Flavobacteriales bacterium]